MLSFFYLYTFVFSASIVFPFVSLQILRSGGLLYLPIDLAYGLLLTGLV